MNKQNLYNITYSQYVLSPGLYIWFNKYTFQIGGTYAPIGYYFFPCSYCGITIILSDSVVLTTDKKTV